MGSWFLCLNLQGWISILHKKNCHFSLFSLYIPYCLIEGQFSIDTLCRPAIIQAFLHLFFQHSGHLKISYYKNKSFLSFSLLIKNKLWSIPESCYLEKWNKTKQNKKAVLLVTLETEVLFEMAVALFLQNFRLISVPQLPSVMPLKVCI